MFKRWGVLFTSRATLLTAALAKARKALNFGLNLNQLKSESSPPWTSPEQSNADRAVQHPGIEQPKPDALQPAARPAQPQPLGASALPSAGKERDVASQSPAEALKPDVRPFQTTLDPTLPATSRFRPHRDSWRCLPRCSCSLPPQRLAGSGCFFPQIPRLHSTTQKRMRDCPVLRDWQRGKSSDVPRSPLQQWLATKTAASPCRPMSRA